MKICIASLAPFVGGAEIAAERLGVGLQNAGHEVVLLLGQRGTVWERMTLAGLRHRYAPMQCTDRKKWLRYIRSRSAIRAIIKDERPDILHSNDLPTHQCISGAAAGLKIPRICHHRSVFDGPGIDWRNKFGADRHLFVSHALKAEMFAASDRQRKSSYAVVHDGIPLPPVAEDNARQAARRKLGLPGDRKIVTFCGRLHQSKGIADLLRAWSMLDTPLRARSQLVIVGEDYGAKRACRAELVRLNVELHCDATFAGYQNDPGQWLLASDIAVVPSHFEPFGLAVVEAMSYSLPVVACAVGGICETVEADGTGLLVPPHSPASLAAAVTRLLTNSDLCRRLGQQGRLRCQAMFSLDTHVRNILGEYEKILQRRAIPNLALQMQPY